MNKSIPPDPYRQTSTFFSKCVHCCSLALCFVCHVWIKDKGVTSLLSCISSLLYYLSVAHSVILAHFIIISDYLLVVHSIIVLPVICSLLPAALSSPGSLDILPFRLSRCLFIFILLVAQSASPPLSCWPPPASPAWLAS